MEAENSSLVGTLKFSLRFPLSGVVRVDSVWSSSPRCLGKSLSVSLAMGVWRFRYLKASLVLSVWRVLELGTLVRGALAVVRFGDVVYGLFDVLL